MIEWWFNKKALTRTSSPAKASPARGSVSVFIESCPPHNDDPRRVRTDRSLMWVWWPRVCLGCSGSRMSLIQSEIKDYPWEWTVEEQMFWRLRRTFAERGRPDILPVWWVVVDGGQAVLPLVRDSRQVSMPVIWAAHGADIHHLPALELPSWQWVAMGLLHY